MRKTFQKRAAKILGNRILFPNDSNAGDRVSEVKAISDFYLPSRYDRKGDENEKATLSDGSEILTAVEKPNTDNLKRLQY